MQAEEQKIIDLKAMAKRMRLAGLDMALNAKDGSHLGGSFSSTEILAVLYGAVLNTNPKNPFDPNRDRFIPSKNHCVLAYLPALAEKGFFPKEELLEFQKDGGRLTGYPKNIEIGHEYSGGSLGMGLSVGIGMALSAKRKALNYTTYVLMGDGELNEGSVWEAFMAAAHFKLNNLCAIIDRNRLQNDGISDEIMNLNNLEAKLKAFGWEVKSVNGHSIEELLSAFKIHPQDKPFAIIANTIKAKGIDGFENKAESHHSKLPKENYEKSIENLNASEEK